jgi:4-amino-4-deoxy-L-arabinose transferase-like glycosyltransferase
VPDSHLAGLLFCAAFLIRLTAWLGAAIFGTDGCHYLLMADWMGEGRYSDALSIAYHPLYPLLIAIVRIPLGSTVDAAGLVSVALGAAAVVPLLRIVRSVFGRPEAFAAALLYAFNPSIIEAQSDILTEGTFAFFFISSMWLTWQMMETPTLARAATLGAAAAAAFLTRPEGILAVAFAVAWPLAELVRRRDQAAVRIGGVALALVVAVVAVFPYLLWIKSVRGHWDLSVRPSMDSAMRAVGLLVDPGSEGEGAGSGMYPSFFKAIYRLTYLVTIPFYLLGLFALRKLKGRAVIFYLSFPLASLAGLLFTLRTHTFMSYRYVVPAMGVLTGVAALGMTTALRWIAARRPQARALPAAAAAALLLLAVLPCVRALNASRWECRSYLDAARWIRARGQPRVLSGPVQQVAYLTGCRSLYSASSHEGIRRQVGEDKVDYYVYTEKDLEKRPAYVAMLRSCDVLDPPVEIVGPPGTWKLYVQRAK